MKIIYDIFEEYRAFKNNVIKLCKIIKRNLFNF